MRRRDFIKLGSAGIAGAAMGNFSAVNAASEAEASDLYRTAGTLKKGFMLGTFPSGSELSLLHKFRMLRNAGFDGVEPGSGLNRSKVLEAKKATGLEIPSVVVSTHWSQPLSSPDPLVQEAGLRGLKVALHDANEYGAGCVLLVPGRVTAEVSYEDVYRRSQHAIRKVVPLAEELGVIIAIENVWNQFLLSPMEAVRYIDEFDSPYVGWYFDTGNIITYGWAHQWIRILGERIVMVHIKEFSRKKRDQEGLWKGFDVNYLEGDNDWPEIMKALGEVGYSGYGIAEPPYQEKGISDEVWLRDYIAGRMGKIFAM